MLSQDGCEGGGAAPVLFYEEDPSDVSGHNCGICKRLAEKYAAFYERGNDQGLCRTVRTRGQNRRIRVPDDVKHTGTTDKTDDRRLSL